MKTLQQRGRRALSSEQGATPPAPIRNTPCYQITEAQFQALVRALWREIAPQQELAPKRVKRTHRRRPSLGQRMAHRVFTGRHR